MLFSYVRRERQGDVDPNASEEQSLGSTCRTVHDADSAGRLNVTAVTALPALTVCHVSLFTSLIQYDDFADRSIPLDTSYCVSVSNG